MKKKALNLVFLILISLPFFGCEEEKSVESPDWAIGKWHCDYGYGIFQNITIEDDDIYFRNNSGGAYISEYGIKDSSYTDTEYSVETEDQLLNTTTHIFTLVDSDLKYNGDLYTKLSN